MKLFDPANKELKKCTKIAEAVVALENKYKALSDDELKVKTVEFKERLNKDSWQVFEGFVEAVLKDSKPMDKYQFIRNGYYTNDYTSKGDKLVFNRIVGLKSSFTA